MDKGYIVKKIFLIIMFTLCLQINAYANMDYILSAPLGYIIAISCHELGHIAAARFYDAENIDMKLSYGVPSSVVCNIEKDNIPAFALSGEVGADLCFELAFSQYKEEETTLNKSILFFAGTDFIRYCIYNFWFDKDNPTADPTIIHDETGISKEMIFSLVLTKSLLNVYRVKSKNNRIVPYFSYDENKYIKISLAYNF